MKRTNRSGYTLIELSIAGALSVIVLGGLALSVTNGMGLFRQSTANQEADAKVERGIARVTRELLGVSQASITQDFTTPPGDPITWTTTVDYQRVTDWVAGMPVLENARSIQLRMAQGETDDGTDEDGDGLIDERDVVLIIDVGLGTEQEVILVSNVSEFLEGETPNAADDNGNGLEDERGFSFDMDGGTLNVRLTVARQGPNGLIQRTQVSSFVLRN